MADHDGADKQAEDTAQLAPPAWLKSLTTWWKGAEILIFMLGLLATLFVGAEKSRRVAGAVFVLILFFCGMSLATRLFLGQLVPIRTIMQTPILSKGQRVSVTKRFRLSVALACLSTGVAAILAIVLAFVLSRDAVYHFFYTATPTQMTVQKAEYVNPTRDKGWLRKQPFFQAIINHLQ